MRPLSLVLVLLCAGRAFAQTPSAAVPLSVEEVVERTLASSPRLAELDARREGAEAAARLRQTAEAPTVAVSGGYTRTNHVDEFGVPQPNGTLRLIYPDIPDNYYARASLQWPIYTGGRADALIAAARAEAGATAADIAVARADLRLEAVRAYWALVTATEALRVVEGALARTGAHLRDISSRFDAGLVPPNDVSAVRAEQARQRMLVIDARNRRASMVEEIRRLTGIRGDITAAAPLASDPPPLAPPPAPPSAGPLSAGPLRPEVDALQQRVEAAAGRASAAAAGRRPTVAVTGAADYANPNPRIFPRTDVWRPSWEVGVVASWTVFDGGRVAAERAEAEAAVRALRARQTDLDARIATDIAQRRLDLESAHAALDAAREAVASAADARRVLAERFAVGVATSTDVLDADVALLQAELERTRTLANIKLAEARLARAEGR